MKKIPLLSVWIMLLLVACKADTKTRKEAATVEKPVIYVTIEPIRYFTETIAGDRFNILSMVPTGHSPETYDPTPKQLLDLSHSTAYFRIGYLGFEQTWIERLSKNAPTVDFIDLSADIPTIAATHSHKHGHGEKTHVEPHIWNSPRNARLIADNIYRALVKLDPEGAPRFQQGRDSLYQEITKTDSIIRSLLSQPDAARDFMIYHPALTYFARDYGLRQLAIEEDGKYPSPARLKRLIDLCRKDSVRLIFIQPEFDKHNAKLIADQTDSRIVAINPLSYYWSSELIRTAEALVPSVSIGNNFGFTEE